MAPIDFYALGKWFYVFGLLGLAVFGILAGDFIISRPPVWSLGGAPYLPWTINCIIIVCSICLLTGHWVRPAAWMIIVLILMINVLIRELPMMFHMDLEGILTFNVYKALIFAGGALLLMVDQYPLATRDRWLNISSIGFVVFFILSGRNHFKYSDFVIHFIPEYIPFRVFWTYFCGVALIAGGFGLMIKPVKAIAALYSGLMILIWFLFLHIPRFWTHSNDLSERMGLCESLAFCGGLFMLYSKWKVNPSVLLEIK